MNSGIRIKITIETFRRKIIFIENIQFVFNGLDSRSSLERCSVTAKRADNDDDSVVVLVRVQNSCQDLLINADTVLHQYSP